ncbi:MAG: hypothetical protein V4773_14445 [Verrucomicrobiota bacterium]
MAIFAIGMVGALALFAPVAKSVTNVGDTESAARVADAIRARLQALPYETALTLIQDPVEVRRKDADGSYNPNLGTRYPAVIFGKPSGEIGLFDTTSGRQRWYDSRNVVLNDADKFFEIDLIRNTTLTPVEGDELSPFVAYTVRVRWPSFVATPGAITGMQVGAGGGGAVAIDNSKKQVMFFTGALPR